MFITRECDYAVRVVRALWGESRLSVSDICEKEAITKCIIPNASNTVGYNKTS